VCSSHAGGTSNIKGLVPPLSAGLDPFFVKLLLSHRRKNYELQKVSAYIDAWVKL
jgi:hypothetical protein